ncbi:hypothetical protein IW152_003176 [Coemansia sp. BCRC 34962]|nr:hypothetical protein IW152_003176 [Coemansia sp. BCRC 34962]
MTIVQPTRSTLTVTTVALNAVSKGSIMPSAMSDGTVTSSSESKHTVAPSSGNNHTAALNANNVSTIVQSTNSDHTAGQGAERKGIAELNTESKHIVVPSGAEANTLAAAYQHQRLAGLPHGTFINVAGEQVDIVTEGNIEIDVEDDIEVDVDNAMEEHTYATTDERADAAMEDDPVAPRDMEESPREGACGFSASYSWPSQLVADSRFALLGATASLGASATQFGVASEQSLGAIQPGVVGGYGTGAANSDFHGEPNKAEDLYWNTDGFMAGDAYSNPTNISNSATDHNSNGKSSAGSGSTVATGDDLANTSIPVTLPGDDSIDNMVAAYALAPGTDVDAALASAPVTDLSDDSIPATATSVSNIVDIVISLRLGVGTDMNTAVVQASAADLAPVASTSRTIYAKERDGIHEYEETLEASGTVPVYRSTLPARPQPTEDPDVGQISEIANGLSLGTDASKDTSPALHSGGSSGSGSATRSESAEESLSQEAKDREFEALIQRTEDIDLDAPLCFNQRTSVVKAPRPYANGIRLSYRYCIRFVLNPGFGHYLQDETVRRQEGLKAARLEAALLHPAFND